MKGEVQKIQEEKVHLMGLEQRLRQEFQTQVQAEQMSNEELRIRLETLQVGVAPCCQVLPQVYLRYLAGVAAHPPQDATGVSRADSSAPRRCRTASCSSAPSCARTSSRASRASATPSRIEEESKEMRVGWQS